MESSKKEEGDSFESENENGAGEFQNSNAMSVEE
jgi:hypothetical protein